MKNNKFFQLLFQKRGQIIAFTVTFFAAFLILLPQKDMILGSGDVADIWKTITSFYSKDVQSSYVLYKGVLSVYPYVWLVALSEMMGLGQWFLLKIFHSLLFSGIVAIGVPYIISNIFKIEIKPWRRVLFCLLGFVLWYSTRIVLSIMIDLPSLFLFVFAACSVVKIAKNFEKINKLYFLYSGLLLGAATLYTGQYGPSVILLILFLIIALFYKKVIKNKKRILTLLLSILLLTTGIAIPKAVDKHFENTFVNQFREKGENIPSGDDWTNLAIGQAKRRYTMFWGPTIENNRAHTIIQKYRQGEDYKNFLDSSAAPFSKKEVLNIILHHPVDYITSWCNGFLLTVSINGRENNVWFLLISYTALFIALYVLFKHWGSLKGVFNKDMLIIIAFILPALVTCVTHFEPRYVIALQSLYLGTAIFSDTFWDIFKNGYAVVKECFVTHTLNPIIIRFNQAKVPYVFIIYCVFVVMCFTNYAAIYETAGINPDILFNW